MVVIDEARPERPALSAPEAAVILRGCKVGDKVVLTLALQELVARDYLGFAIAVELRRFGPPKRTAVLTPGSARGPACNAVLASVLGVFEQAQPFQSRSTRQDIEDRIAESLHAAEPDSSLRKIIRATGQLFKAKADALPIVTYSDGTTGVPVSALARAIFRRYPYRGWYSSRTEGFVRGSVLPILIFRGLFSRERKPTPQGQDVRARLQAELSVGRGGKATLRALANDLASLAPGTDIEHAFSAIERGVSIGWNDEYGGD